RSVTIHRLATLINKIERPANRLITISIQKKNHETAVYIPPQFLISLRTCTPPGTSTFSDWGPRAERLDRSLDAYTPVPSTPSSMGALVQSETIVTDGPKWTRMVAYFRERFQA